MKIKVTTDKEYLTRVWGADWAEKHAGKVYEATIDNSDWAIIEGTKFPKDAYTEVK